MYRFWCVLFALVPILGSVIFVLAPDYGWWFPENISAERGKEIDGLFMQVFVITSVTFIGCNILLVLFMWKYADKGDREKGIFTHGSHKIETLSVSATSLMLLYMALSQMGIWMDAKFADRARGVPEIARVYASQFEWRMVYPGPDGEYDTFDDIHSNSVLAFPANREVKINLRSRDVLHSFFLPNLRVKQDAVPGMKIPVWFQATEAGEYDLVCAELCGWGHYKMKGRILVLPPAKDPEEAEAGDGTYEGWLKAQAANSTATRLAKSD